MQIFLSYASDDKAIAEPIAFSLRARGHKVFLDRDDLPAGGEYDHKIEKAVQQSALFIFLISPASVAKGRFTLTELEFARQKWKKPDGRVLPVMAAPTPIIDVPSFLKSVTILEPKGNVAAEVASAAVELVRDKDRRSLYVLGGLCLLSGLLTNSAQTGLVALVGDAVIHRDITVSRVLSGGLFGIALVAAFAYLAGFRLKMLLIPIVVSISFFAAMETFFTVAPIFNLKDPTMFESAELRDKCSAFNRGESQSADPVLKQACDALNAFDQRGSALTKLMSLPAFAVVYLLAGLVGALLTYLGAVPLSDRRMSVAGIVSVPALGAIAAAVIGTIMIQFGVAIDSTLLFASWQPVVGMALARFSR